MSSLPLISIIIPVYNTEKYLRQCIDSVIHQTYRNIEIILVDDGSEDSSGLICDAYKVEDPRIVVIHKENEGIAKARNSGMDIARGEYIMFVDSDDWIDNIMCETMMNALSEHKVQSAMCSYIREYPDKPMPKIINSQTKVFDNQMLLRKLCGLVGEELKHPENLDNYNPMCFKIYPSASLKGIYVTDIRLLGSSEDLLFNIHSFSNINNMVYINEPLYHYRKNIETSITSQYKSRLEIQWNHLYDLIEEFIEENELDASYTVALNNRIAINTLSLGLNCIRANLSHLQKLKRLNDIITDPRRKAALKGLSLKPMPIYWKVFYFSAKHRMVFLLYILLYAIAMLKGKV